MSLVSKLVLLTEAIALYIKNLNSFSRLTVDTTGLLEVTPVKFVHNNTFTNSPTPYMSGTFLFEALAQNNNQPIIYSRKKVNTSSLGNSANFIIQNTGGDILNSSIFAADFEKLANNPLINPYNGKAELGINSGSTASGESGDGWIYFATRRTEQHPSGANTGFDPIIKIHNHKYGAHFRHLGSKMGIYPTYDVGVAGFYIENTYNDAVYQAWSRVAGGNASLHLYSGSANRETTGGDYKIRAAGSSGRLAFLNSSAGNITIAEFLDTTGNNTLCLYGTDVSTGQLRLGNTTHSMIIKGASKEYDFTANGNALLKTNGSNYLKNIEEISVSPTAGGTSIITFTALQTHIFFNTATIIENYTITLGVPLKSGQEVIIYTRQGTCTNFTLNSTDGTAVFYNAPTSLTANQKLRFKYRANGNAWW